MLYIVRMREITHVFAVVRRLDILVRGKMIRHQRNLRIVENALLIEFLHPVDGNRARDIIGQHHIQIGHDQLSGFYVIESCRVSKNLLCHCHSHDITSCISCFLFQ